MKRTKESAEQNVVRYTVIEEAPAAPLVVHYTVIDPTLAEDAEKYRLYQAQLLIDEYLKLKGEGK